MFCANCGKLLDDHDLFCTECGTPVERLEVTPDEPQNHEVSPETVEAPDSPVEDNAEPTMDCAEEATQQVPEESPLQEPAEAPKKKRPWRIIVPIVAAVCVVAIVLVVLLSTIGSAAAKVGAAFTNTMKEYAEIYDVMGIPYPDAYVDKTSFSENLQFKLTDFPEFPELEGIGVRTTLDMNLDERQLSLSMTPMYSSIDILSAQILLQDNELYAMIPQLTDDRAYMVNTETIGEDVANLTGNSEDSSLSINFFDLAELVQDQSKLTDADKEKIKEAATILLKAVQVEKDGKYPLQVNDHELECTVYDVVLPEAALTEYFQAMEKIYPYPDAAQMYSDIMKEIGIPEETIEDVLAELKNAEIPDPFTGIYESLEETGDLAVQVGIHKNLVVYMNCALSISDTPTEVTIQLGGGTEYVDDLRADIVTDKGQISIISSGDHGCSAGVFTDETILELTTDGETITVSSEIHYEPSGSSDNFLWAIKTMEEKFTMRGYVRVDKDSILAELDEVSFWSNDEHTLSMSVNFETGEYTPSGMDTTDAVEILTLSEEELEEELILLEDNAMDWAQDLILNNPEIMALLESMM